MPNINDLEVLAYQMSTLPDTPEKKNVVRALCRVLRKNNPRFDEFHFSFRCEYKLKDVIAVEY